MMKSFLIPSAFQLCLLVLCVAFCTAENTAKEPKRSKMVSYALTPSLRIGRRSEGTWDRTLELKRGFGNLMHFPRVGRGSSRFHPGMWFEPQMGHLQKRNADEAYAPWTYIILNGEGPISRQVHYTPRLGRESEEIGEEQANSNEDNIV